MINHVKVGASVHKVSTLVDGSVKAEFVTQELGDKDCAALMGLRKKVGWLIFAPQNTEIEIPRESPVEFKGDKTPSQRLRGVLYRLWEQGKQEMTSDEFYKVQMAKLIDHFKAKLEN